MGLYARRGVYTGTGAAWVLILVLTAAEDISLKPYLTAWLLTLILSLTTVAILMTRPDHGLLAQARIKLIGMRAQQALEEQERDLTPYQMQETPPQGWPASQWVN